MPGWPQDAAEALPIGVSGVLGQDYLRDLAPLTALVPLTPSSRLACGDQIGRLWIWDVFVGHARVLPGRSGASPSPMVALASPEEWACMSLHEDGTLALWNIDEGAQVRECAVEPGGGALLAAGPGGLVARASGADSIAFHEASRLVVSGAITPDVGPVTAMRWLDAATLLVAHDRLLRGYLQSGEIRCEVEAPAGIRSLWILEGRRILVTGHEDGSIRTWKVPGRRARGSAVSSFELSKTYSVATSAILAAAPQSEDPCISWIAAEGAAGHFRTSDGRECESVRWGEPVSAAAMPDGDTVYAVTGRGVPWIWNLGYYRGFAPTRVFPAGPVVEEPSGAWVTVAGEAQIMVCDADGTFREAGPPLVGTTQDLAWDAPTERVFLAASEDAPAEFELDDERRGFLRT